MDTEAGIFILKNASSQDLPSANDMKSYYDRYIELNRKFSNYPVEMGAMKNEIDQWKINLFQRLKAINESVDIVDEDERNTIKKF